MKIDRDKFFAKFRSDFGALKQGQVDGTNALLAAWESIGTEDVRWLAYVLATAWHETASTMQPIAEYGHGRGHSYGNLDPVTGEAYYGRGYVQLTWKANYLKAGTKVGADLVNKPDLAMQPDIAAKVAIQGMIEGWFTGKRLGNYFNNVVTDYVGARRIINGQDKAELIGGYAEKFHDAVMGAVDANAKIPPAPPAAPAPVPPPMAPKVIVPPTPTPPDVPAPKPVAPMSAPQSNWLVTLFRAFFGRN